MHISYNIYKILKSHDKLINMRLFYRSITNVFMCINNSLGNRWGALKYPENDNACVDLAGSHDDVSKIPPFVLISSYI